MFLVASPSEDVFEWSQKIICRKKGDKQYLFRNVGTLVILILMQKKMYTKITCKNYKNVYCINTKILMQYLYLYFILILLSQC